MYTMTTSCAVLDERLLVSGNWCEIFFANVETGENHTHVFLLSVWQVLALPNGTLARR
jgi:hypothetical protein